MRPGLIAPRRALGYSRAVRPLADRRRAGAAAGRQPVSRVRGAADRRGGGRRLGQPDVPAGPRAVGPAADRPVVRAAGRQGAGLAARAGAAAPAPDSGAGRAWRARGRLPVSVVVYRWLEGELSSRARID